MSGDASQETLEATHTTLSSQAEALYASLNIQGNFPELQDLPLEFVRTLLMMRGLKINIRKHAIGSFYEWETLDRAVSGRWEALGTKLHQATRKAISKSQLALMRSIHKFNDYCELLARLRPENCTIPIPSALSTQLNGPIPGWLSDSDVHDGIRSLHSADRCGEESIRLELERENLEAWLTEEIEIVAHVLDTRTDPCLDLALRERQDHLRSLKLTWQCGLLRLRRTVITHPPCPVASAVSAAAASAAPVAAVPTAAAAVVAVAAAAAATAIDAAATVDPIVPGVGILALPNRILQLQLEDETYEDGAAIFEARDDPTTNMIVAPEELDPGTISDAEEPLAVQDMLDHADEEEEEPSGIDGEVQLEIKWRFTESANVDVTLLQELQAHNDLFGVEDDRLQHVVGIHIINPPDLDTLRTCCGRLNNYCLNGVAAVLHRLFSNPSAQTAPHTNCCAVLSTLNLMRVRYKASDDTIWKFLSPTSYWDKSIWLIPIHRPMEEHWVLIVAVIPEQKLFLFDSLGSRNKWHQDLKDVMTLITRMVVLANRNKHPLHVTTAEELWTALPLYNKKVQSNWYDCGVWVLCMMAAIMRSYTNTNLSEADMGHARQVLTGHILTLPLT
ncbi:hypothetical protein MSAN_00132000 [Mycena sanguinolenta]|uniref:Ubiquitin-like protease family profile domain-containing protein n=1 Tax=Mycena sanguinolenta TaxID=230812 RepID=A0A8H6ZDP1_9AGAR|nr:hypothetical protein MSAN_00132000 [Mycena sanguinolenta]